MRKLLFILCVLKASGAENFLTFSKAELCKAEPQMKMCRRNVVTHAVKSFQSEKENPDEVRDKSEQEGFIPENPQGNPFEEIATRTPPGSAIDVTSESESTQAPKKHFRNLNDYYKYIQLKRNEHRERTRNGLLYRVYPGTHPKDSYYCPDMRAMFAYTCQPSKPLRLDLVEFCKDYSAFCNVPNFHRLPGPRMGPPIDRSIGHVGVSGRFGLGIGALPGFDVGAGWGVDVGPIPGLGEDVGVGLGLDLGIVGAKSSPEAFRRGQDNPDEKGGGVVGISGGIGVKAPGGGNVGVGSGIGVGK